MTLNPNGADVREVGRDTLDPILFLLQSGDIEVQRAASAALGNLAVNSMPSPRCPLKLLKERQARTRYRSLLLVASPHSYGK